MFKFMWPGLKSVPDIWKIITVEGLYNGNISWMNTDLPGLENNKRMQAMVYSYDQLHRIVQARSLTDYSQGNGYTSRDENPSPYDVDYTYDPNEGRALRKCPVDIFSLEPGCGLVNFTA